MLQWLSDQGLFPLESFVLVDPDRMRKMLPESAEYRRRDPLTAGQYTQKEVGFLSEILTMQGLLDAKNVLVDGSLRDAAWYIDYVRNLRSEFPELRVGIVYVTASMDTILKRVQVRAEQTGRAVPEKTLRDTHEQVPRSITLLSPYADVIVTFENEGGSVEPRLLNMSYYSPGESESIVAPGDDDYLVGFSPPPHSMLSSVGEKILLASAGTDRSHSSRPRLVEDPPSHSLSVVDLPHFASAPPRTEVTVHSPERKPAMPPTAPSWFHESSPAHRTCPSPDKLSGRSSPASSLEDFRDMNLLLDGGLTARSVHSESSLASADYETASSGSGFRKAGQMHGSSSGLQGMLRQSRRRTPLSAPWERARRVRKPVANDNTWWRDEFKALWEMRCKIPAFGALKRTNIGADDDS